MNRELNHDDDGSKNVINLHIWQRKKAASMWVSLTDALRIELFQANFTLSGSLFPEAVLFTSANCGAIEIV